MLSESIFRIRSFQNKRPFIFTSDNMHTFLKVGLMACRLPSMDMMMDGRKMPPLAPDNPLLQGFIKMCPGGNPADGVNLQLTAATPSPRIIKTHLPLSLLHPNLLDTIKVTLPL